jgi:membrane protein
MSKASQAEPAHFEAAEPGRGRAARSPLGIPWAGWRDILWRTWQEIGADRLNAVAGGITFYTLLAIFPAVGMFVSLYGLVADVGQVGKQLNEVAAFVPRDVLGLVGDQMTRLAGRKHDSLSLAFAVSLFLSMWSADNGMNALFDGLNIAFDEEERRNFFARRAVTLGFTLAAIVFAVPVTAVLVAAPLALDKMGASDLLPLVVPLRWAVLLALATAAFAVVYRYGPSRERARWRWVTVGGAISAVVWVGGSLAFSWYAANVANFDATYGSLAAVMGFMMWIWFSAMVVLIGAELNAEIEHQTALDSTTGRPEPMGRRGAAMADTVGQRFVGFSVRLRHLQSVAKKQINRLRRRWAG